VEKFFTYAFIVGAAQGLLLSIFLFRKKENKIANNLLAVTMLLFSIDLVLEAAAVTEDIKAYPLLIGLMQTLPYLYGPSIYLYIIFITQGIKSFNFKYLLHYLPFVFVQVYGLFFFYFEPIPYQLNLVYVELEMPWHLLLVSYITPIYGGFYIVLAVYEGYKFNRELKNRFSSIDKHNLSWVTFLVVGSVLLWITAIFMTSLQLFFGKEIRPELVSYLAISAFIYAMAYKGLRQPEVIVFDRRVDEIEKENKTKSYKNSGLDDSSAEEYVRILLKLMNEKKPFKNEKLNLPDLSGMLGISTHNLSEIINTRIEQNFYDFVNSYRVEEAKKLIHEDKTSTYSILSHGMEAGFSSKSAFYSAFKKFTRMTPAQFRKKPN
jgi:AraC-like DNA-binding protein